MQYEIINPSDCYTFVANNREIASLATFLLSTRYSAKAESGNEGDNVPMFFFGGADEWYQETFGRTCEDGIKALKSDISSALASVMLGGFEDRRRYDAAIAAITDEQKRQEFIDAWQDGRSSMNNIGSTAHSIAKQLKLS